MKFAQLIGQEIKFFNLTEGVVVLPPNSEKNHVDMMVLYTDLVELKEFKLTSQDSVIIAMRALVEKDSKILIGSPTNTIYIGVADNINGENIVMAIGEAKTDECTIIQADIAPKVIVSPIDLEKLTN